MKRHVVFLLCVALSSVAMAEDANHVMFAFVDHFEPLRPGIPEVRIWVDDYIAMASKHIDADGRHPIHSYFQLFPMPESRLRESLTILNDSTYKGYGEVEYHLHHGITDERNRTEVEATQELIYLTAQTQDIFNSHGALITAEPTPSFTFGFIHGTWALDNSRYNTWTDPCDPHYQSCGVNWELQILGELGAYADFTFPSPMPMTPPTKDSIFYVEDDEIPASYKDANHIRMVEVNQPEFGDLMIIEGPDTRTNIGIKREDYNDPATLDRMDGWVGHNVHVIGQDKWVFVKVYTHGCMEDLTYQPAWDAFFGETMDSFYNDIEAKYNDGISWKLHYVSAREMYNIIKAAEAGMTGDPGQYRDFLIKPYANMLILTQNQYRLISYDTAVTLVEILDTNAVVEFNMKGFGPDAIIAESTNLAYGWQPSNALLGQGEFGELHFLDTTPSRYYRIYVADICPPYPIGDLDNNCRVDWADFALFAAHWLVDF